MGHQLPDAGKIVVIFMKKPLLLRYSAYLTVCPSVNRNVLVAFTRKTLGDTGDKGKAEARGSSRLFNSLQTETPLQKLFDLFVEQQSFSALIWPVCASMSRSTPIPNGKQQIQSVWASAMVFKEGSFAESGGRE